MPAAGLAGATGSQTFFKLTVPAGQSDAVFQLSGGTGDADLYVKLGAKPTMSTFDCRPFLNGNNETCTINNPAAGDYFVMVRGFAAFSGATLVGHAQLTLRRTACWELSGNAQVRSIASDPDARLAMRYPPVWERACASAGGRRNRGRAVSFAPVSDASRRLSDIKDNVSFALQFII